MTPAFRYFGGKGRLAPWIVSLIPPHVSYIEPFFGAGSVLLNKPISRHELINDLDGNVINFYRVLRDDLDALVEACRLTPYARDEFNYCKWTAYAEDPHGFGPLAPVEAARRFFTVVSQSFACTTGSASGWSASTHKNVNRAKSTQHYVDRFEQVADRLRMCMIENTDAERVINLYARAESVVYLDPPYVHSTRGDTNGGHGYRHEMTNDAHEQLSVAAHATEATVLLSGYSSDLYDELYADWHRTDRATYSTVAGIALDSDDIKTARTEVLWSNRPIGGQRRLFEGAVPATVPIPASDLSAGQDSGL